MAQLWGGLLRLFGTVLEAIYHVIPSYGVALILLTIITRAIIAPLGIKQIRSMQQMQKLQPKIKELQKKYKGDRQKLNEEMMKLYKEHGANPLGGCVPMIAQFPVFIALYAVIRAVVPVQANVAATTTVPTFAKATICRPANAAEALVPKAGGPIPTHVICDFPSGQQTIEIAGWQDPHTGKTIQPPPYLSLCAPRSVKDADGKDTVSFACHSPLGTGHLPKDGKLFKALIADKGTFLGMHLACSPNQASTGAGSKLCTASGKKASGLALVAYYSLVLLMAGSTFIQQRQMSSRATGAQAQQMKMMGTMMPVVFGFLSLQFPAALSIYWIAGNVWTIAQQKIVFGKDEPPAPAAPKKKDKK